MTPSPRILFGGGGDAPDSRPLDQIYAAWLGPQARLLYLPTALITRAAMRAGLAWIKSAFAPLGITRIDAWFDLAGKNAGDLLPYSGVYIGGGNTFYLLDQIRKHRLDSALADFILQGRPAYGGSAGAAILARDISSVAHIDEDIVGLSDLRGLDLAFGHMLYCHYIPANDALIRAAVQRTGLPAIGISERSGVRREGEHLYAAGFEPAHVFSGDRKVTFQAGEIII